MTTLCINNSQALWLSLFDKVLSFYNEYILPKISKTQDDDIKFGRLGDDEQSKLKKLKTQSTVSKKGKNTGDIIIKPSQKNEEEENQMFKDLITTYAEILSELFDDLWEYVDMNIVLEVYLNNIQTYVFNSLETKSRIRI